MTWLGSYQMFTKFKIVNHLHCQNTTHYLGGIKTWKAKFSLGRRPQDSEEGNAERHRRGGGRVKVFYRTKQSA